MNDAAKQFPNAEDFETIKSQIQEEKINNKLIVICGPAGSGKTTNAISKYSATCIFPYGYRSEPKDLLQAFVIEDGIPQFKISELDNAMANGDTVLFDEGDCLDDKWFNFIETITTEDEIDLSDWGVNDVKGKIKIAPSFKVIVVFTAPSRCL